MTESARAGPDAPGAARSSLPAKGVFLAWTGFQRRPLSMRPFFGFDVYFLGRARPGLWLKAWDYARRALRSLLLLYRVRPTAVWVQLPPTPALAVALVYRTTSASRARVIADCHNSMLRPPWIDTFGSRGLLRLVDLVLVHNDSQLVIVQRAGIPEARVLVLEDPPAELAPAQLSSAPPPRRPFGLFPASLSDDEPIAELLDAARIAAEITFVITGRVGRERRQILALAPPNVLLTGFLPVGELDWLLSTADFVLGLTSLDGVQLSVCNEGVAARCPLVLSRTETLRRLFPRGTVFVDSRDPRDIAAGCRRAIAEGPALRADMSAFLLERLQAWRTGQAAAVLSVLHATYHSPR